MLAGRQFDARDSSMTVAAIVNRTFAEILLELSNALGVRFRDAADGTRGRRSEWYEVVGVIDDFPGFLRMPGSGGEPTVYLPGAPGDFQLAVLSLQFNDTIPTDVAERLRHDVASSGAPSASWVSACSLAPCYRSQSSSPPGSVSVLRLRFY